MKNEMTNRLGFFDPFFEDFFVKEYKRTNNELMKTNIKDEGDHYSFEVELPQVKKENVKVSVEDGYMTIYAEYNNSENEKNSNGKYIRRERYYGECSRSFYIGDDIKTEDVKASFKNGILTLNIPKKTLEDKESEKNYISID